jgi:hypothetical protein
MTLTGLRIVCIHLLLLQGRLYVMDELLTKIGFATLVFGLVYFGGQWLSAYLTAG